MASYLITYDNKPPRNYTALYNLMASWEAVRLAESVWMANLVGPAGKVRDIVQSKLQRDDVVAVLELKAGSDWATSHVGSTANAWLSTYIAPTQKAA